MFLGSFVDGQRDIPDQSECRGDEYLALRIVGVNSNQQMTKSPVGQGLHEAYHDVLEAF